MVKLFISQPMNGKTEEQILKEREKAIARARTILKDDVAVLDSYFEDYVPQGGNIALQYLAKSLSILAKADVLYSVGDWREYRGCRIENLCAKEYGISVIED